MKDIATDEIAPGVNIQSDDELLDWVKKNAGPLGIKVINLSMGGRGRDDGNCGMTNNDVLHRAMLSPYATLGKLSPAERDRLLEAIREVLAAALEIERRRTGGLPTKIGDHFTVHGRYGEPCPRCGDDLRRVSYESHEVTYCPTCQTGGKRLSDRRLDRLIR